MKKLLLFFILAILTFTFVSCGKTPEANNSNGKPSVDEEVEEEEEEEEEEEPEESDEEEGIVNIGKLDYKLVYDPYKLGMEDLAENFRDDFEDETDVELTLLEYADAKKEKYRIFIGEISTNGDSSRESKSLSELSGKNASAFSIKFSDNTLMVSGTSKNDVKRALAYLISLIDDGALRLESDFSYTEFAVSYGSGEIYLSAEEFKSLPSLAEIKLNNQKLEEYSMDDTSYVFGFPATENYPKIEVSTVNPNATVDITLPEENDGVCIISVLAEDEVTTMSYEIEFTYDENAEISAEIVNKDGKGGVITFVFDDGDLRSADIIISKLMKKYNSIRPSFAIICNQLASAEWNGDDIDITPLTYNYSPILNSLFSTTKYKYEFWKTASGIEGVDVLSHSYSHTNEGINSDPVFELKASQKILWELCDADSLCYVLPGAGTITNPAYLENLQGGEIYLGARSTSRTVNYVGTYNPFKVSAYAVTRHSTKMLEDGTYTTNENSSRELCLEAGVETWKAHIDEAVNNGGWAAFCFHGVCPAGLDTTGKWVVFEEQLEEIFKYADGLSKSGDAWVANFTEASIYYREWKESTLKVNVFSDESVSAKLECPLDSEEFNMALTAKIPVPMNWTSAFLDGEELEINENEDGTKFVYVNLIPNADAVTITK